MRLKAGDLAPPFQATDLQGREQSLTAYRGSRLLLSFHRYAACPMCNLHIHELTTAFPSLEQHGLHVVAVFMSGPDRLADQFSSRAVPFPIVADPTCRMYSDYRIEYSVAGMLVSFVHPRAMKAFFSGFMPGKIDARTTTLPADFLIDEQGTIRDVWYSSNITQHLPLNRIQAFAAAAAG